MSTDGRSAAGDAQVRVVLRPYGTPIALGLAAIMLGTTMLSGLQLGWLGGAADQRTVGFVGLAAAFPLELVAAVFSFLARDALAATGLGTFSSVWAVSGLGLLTSPPASTSHALGMFLVVGAEDIPGRSLLPVGRSGRAASSLRGGLGDQLEELEHEAGVRRQL
jgi:uncharacterized protein